jgi:hypothetical protein
MHHPGTRPSPALIVAMIALVAALAGTANALPGSNMIDRDDLRAQSVSGKAIQQGAVNNHKIKDGAVTDVKLADGSVVPSKIADAAVTGSKLADDAVTGRKVDESTLGEVPSAENLSYQEQFDARMSFGDDVELISNGPISVRARCVKAGTFQTSPNLDGIELYARTTEAGSFLNGGNSRRGDLNANGLVDAESLDPGDPIETSSLAIGAFGTAAAPDESGVGHLIDTGFVASPSGHVISIDDSSTVLGLRVMGSDCVAIGTFLLHG